MKQTFLAILLLMSAQVSAQVRQETVLTDGWQFSRDGESWQSVRVPHDWAIAGPFDKKWDLQRVAIEQNGETEATEKSGRSGALPWIGEGHYKRTLQIPDGCAHAELLFDGAMSEPTVFVGGKKAGYWAYGYNSFRVDITPFVGKGDNTLEVHLRNVEESSRWYPGAGIYRPVTLITTGRTRLDDWSIFVRTMTIGNDKAELEIEGRIVGADEHTAANIILTGPDGQPAGAGGSRSAAEKPPTHSLLMLGTFPSDAWNRGLIRLRRLPLRLLRLCAGLPVTVPAAAPVLPVQSVFL